MERDFDKVIDRRNTNSEKYDYAVENGKPADVLPMWVADMDFQAPKAVTDKLEEISRFGIFGYSNGGDEYFNAVHDWYFKHFDWDIKSDWMLNTPGVVFGVSMAVCGLTEPGDGVMIQQPVYYPFKNVIENNGRKMINNQLVLKNGRYEMDMADFEKKLQSGDVKLFILCSPHNPVGRVWTEDELRAVGELCVKYSVPVVSDEIHGDFTYPGHKHHVFANLDERFAAITVTCTAPSKTFNLAGLQVSNLFVSDRELRRKVYRRIRNTGYGGLNIMGIAACRAAYESGEAWLEELKGYLVGNLEYIREFLKTRIPEIKLIEPEGTYLVWLDLRKLGMTAEAQEKFVVEEAGLWLDSGTMFGEAGTGFERINIACPRATVERAMTQLEAAVKKLRD